MTDTHKKIEWMSGIHVALRCLRFICLNHKVLYAGEKRGYSEKQKTCSCEVSYPGYLIYVCIHYLIGSLSRIKKTTSNLSSNPAVLL